MQQKGNSNMSDRVRCAVMKKPMSTQDDLYKDIERLSGSILHYGFGKEKPPTIAEDYLDCGYAVAEYYASAVLHTPTTEPQDISVDEVQCVWFTDDFDEQKFEEIFKDYTYARFWFTEDFYSRARRLLPQFEIARFKKFSEQHIKELEIARLIAHQSSSMEKHVEDLIAANRKFNDHIDEFLVEIARDVERFINTGW